jgi:SAM-dependent methyltransferase
MARRLPAGRRRLAELGCGSGGMLEALDRFGTAVGVETDPALLARARERGLDVRPGALPDHIPLEPEAWDAVCLFDVLEHVDDEAGALAACRRLLAPGGRLFVTVPAYAWLWSRHDELLGHRRRYTAGRLRRAAGAAGLAPERLTYFNTLLAPPIMAVRLARAALRRPGHDLARPGPLVNRGLAACFAAEARLLRWVSPPFGISILLVARRAEP